MLCVVIVLTAIIIGLLILWSQKSEESTPKEKDFDSILSLTINFLFFCPKICF
jgi:hypothetical protein